MNEIKILKQFPTETLEAEILSRQKCQFSRLTCTKTAEEWIIIRPLNHQRVPTCWNCKQDILSLLKDTKTK